MATACWRSQATAQRPQPMHRSARQAWVFAATSMVIAPSGTSPHSGRNGCTRRARNGAGNAAARIVAGLPVSSWRRFHSILGVAILPQEEARGAAQAGGEELPDAGGVGGVGGHAKADIEVVESGFSGVAVG